MKKSCYETIRESILIFQFEITPEDCKDQPITASTATACHCAVLRRLNKARGKETTNTGSGPEFFGYSHPTVQYLIQSLSNVNNLEKYKWVKFELPAKGTGQFAFLSICDFSLSSILNLKLL